MKHSRGVSLVELLLALSACGVILTLSTGLIHRMLLAESRAREGVRMERTALRLANAFRRDAWEASAASMPPSEGPAAVLVRLPLPQSDQAIEYRREAGTIVRTLTRGQELIGREYFTFPEHCRVEVVQETPRLLRLTVISGPLVTIGDAPEPQDPFSPPLALEVCARVGRASTGAAKNESRP